jgi:hypothetical protein
MDVLFGCFQALAGTTMIRFTCIHCGVAVGVPDSSVGKTGRCLSCKGLFTIPQPANSNPSPNSHSNSKTPKAVSAAALAAAPAGARASASGDSQSSASLDSLDLDIDENAGEASYETDILPADFVPPPVTPTGRQWRHRLERRPASNTIRRSQKANHRIRVAMFLAMAIVTLIAMAFVVVMLKMRWR